MLHQVLLGLLVHRNFPQGSGESGSFAQCDTAKSDAVRGTGNDDTSGTQGPDELVADRGDETGIDVSGVGNLHRHQLPQRSAL